MTDEEKINKYLFRAYEAWVRRIQGNSTKSKKLLLRARRQWMIEYHCLKRKP